jgi:serine/threonine-protein kinase RsbW
MPELQSVPIVHDVRVPHSAAVVSLRAEAEVAAAVGRVTAAMQRAGYGGDDVFAMRLALEEALANAVRHGNRCDPAKEARLRYEVRLDRVLAEVEDQGAGFDPSAVPDPMSAEALDRPGGRGLLLMRCYATWVHFNNRGNRVTLCRERSAGPPAG